MVISVPAAIVMILPVAAMRLDTTALELSVQPSAPPSDMVKMSLPSLTPLRSASMMTVQAM